MNRTDFASIVPRVKVWETMLLNKSFYEKLINLNSLEEAIKSLQETIYSEGIQADGYEEFLELTYKELCDELDNSMMHKDIVKFVRLKNDYGNIKTLVKSKILNKDFSYMLSKNGTVDIEIMKKSFKNEDYSDLNMSMKDCILSSFECFEEKKDIQKIDILIDKAMFDNLVLVGSVLDSKFMMGYTEMLIDLTNLKTTLRVKKLNKDKTFLKEVLLDKGSVSVDLFLEALNTNIEDMQNKFARTNYDKLVTDSVAQFVTTNSLSALEKNIDDYIMNYVKDAKFISLGVEPVFAYLYAKETELKNLRIVLTGKANMVDSKIINERLRDSYV